eukprot:TRINITY_DN35467_c0_g1_i1.p2 TRINITY_DN35467_c0_g1~~TRINITY_DN35467_c0_g1_i1.p2  ORF type:complete len:177 (-),score=30.62 TRINITY_DN35467_c0_g1_i1:69-575(-)
MAAPAGMRVFIVCCLVALVAATRDPTTAMADDIERNLEKLGQLLFHDFPSLADRLHDARIMVEEVKLQYMKDRGHVDLSPEIKDRLNDIAQHIITLCMLDEHKTEDLKITMGIRAGTLNTNSMEYLQQRFATLANSETATGLSPDAGAAYLDQLLAELRAIEKQVYGG